MSRALQHLDLREQTLFLCGPAPYQRPREVAQGLLAAHRSEEPTQATQE